MRRRLALALTGGVVLAAAAFLVLLARGVSEAERRVESGGVAQAAAAGAPAPSLSGPGRLARAVLGVGDDEGFQEALGLIERSRDPSLASQEAIKLHAEAIARLSPLAAGGGDAAMRSRAAGLIGALFAIDSQLDSSSGARYLEQAVKALRLAVKLDPGNEDAKVNLELLLGVRPPGSRAGAGSSEGSGFSTGSGSGGTGSGY